MQGGGHSGPVLGEPLRDAGADAILDRFCEWIDALGLEPYPAQDEAFLELAADRHVILGTPTGSGKSLVAVFLHWKALCEGARSFYTAPTKALVSEKFFALCETFGAEQVGMLTGDASINAAAPIICCTAEVLGSMALRGVEAELPPYVVMDEFHYYGDRDRGVAWQVPLLVLSRTRFLLMSATLGDTSELADRIRAATGREVSQIHRQERPVPLDFEYRETALHETVEELLEDDLAPIYIVHFTQREAAEQAQALTSAKVSSREHRQRVGRELGRASFDTPYGKDLRRFLGFGIGVHHAGLLPRYRLLVEQLSQKGLLRVICGTDTLGVGVNIPIRTVLFSGLTKYDGQKIGLLKVREFKQISGRAGRRGFDDRGSVVCQAPAHAIENKKRATASKGGKGKKGRRPSPKGPKGPTWSKDTFQKLIHQPPEPLESRFDVTHGMLVHVLQRGSGYRALIDLIDASHEPQREKHRMRRSAAVIFRSLRRAGLLDIERDPGSRFTVKVSADLQDEFALDQTLDLFLVEAIGSLDPDDPDYALGVLSLVEAVQEDPRQLLYRQESRIKSELMDQLKAERVPFDERIRLLDEVTWPKPNAEFIYGVFAGFAELHPWVRAEYIRPKGIAREMFESYAGFDDFVRLYGLARSEGLLLRYLNAVYRTLVKTVPEAALDERLEDAREYLRGTIVGVDSSLAAEWESLLAGKARAAAPDDAEEEPGASGELRRLLRDERALRARVRSELHVLVRCLAARDYEGAEAAVRQRPTDFWSAERFSSALAPFYEKHGELRFDHAARLAEQTLFRSTSPQHFEVTQILLDPEDERDWYVECEVELGGEVDPAGPLARVVRIGC